MRAFCLNRSHLNPLGAGHHSLAEKRLAGSRPLTYADAVNAIRLARREGSRRGIGPQQAAAMLNAMIWDSLEPGEAPDIVAVPCEPSRVEKPKSPELEELEFVRAHSELHASLAAASASNGIDEREAGQLRRLKSKVDREFDDVLRAWAASTAVVVEVRR